MQDKNIISVLENILNESSQSIKDFYQGLSEEERARPGELKEWQAKEIVIHGLEWCKLFNQAIIAIQNNQTPHLEEDYLGFNDRKYLETKDQTWQETFTDMDAVFAQALTIVHSLNAEELMDPDYHLIFKNQTVASQMIGYYFTHPMYHQAEYSYKNGRGDAAIEKMMKVAEHIALIDESPHARATSLYNVACFFSLMDKPEDALSYLEQVFPHAPELKKWAREDTDLIKLHQNEKFIALTEPE